MKIKVLKQTDNELKIEIDGSGHGVCNLLQKKLLEHKKIDQAGYDVPHPLASNPIIYVRTSGKVKPKEVLLEAAADARESNQAFGKALEEAIKS
ncbi:MAG: DNA-directed RNA polymerase subunit L [Candidatus Bathyarchaeota archaeon]|nr:DNA-directed RNA polymerase subunit L [Candidatus Bathyarchaeota archaeon]